MSLMKERLGKRPYEPLPVLAADDPITCSSYTKGNGISHIEGCQWFQESCKKGLT